MKIVILCQALLFTTLTAALPTSLPSTRTPESSQQAEPVPLDFPEVELLNSDKSASDEDLKVFENSDLFEGDIIISPEEIELYYGKQNNTHVRLKTYS